MVCSGKGKGNVEKVSQCFTAGDDCHEQTVMLNISLENFPKMYIYVYTHIICIGISGVTSDVLFVLAAPICTSGCVWSLYGLG